jgi:pimeloyl-ACP methyl ester carboxylesterase
MPATTTPNGVSIHYDTFGSPDHPAMLLIQGLGAQMLGWREGFCRRLADRGHHVIRFDNRDVGLSQKFPDSRYTLADMADDTAGLLDALNIDTAHIVGQSMGGVIAQYLTLNHPSRVLSLTLVYSTPSTNLIHGIDLLTGRLKAKPARNRDEAIELFVQNEAAAASPRYPRDLGWIRALGGLMYDRCYDPNGVQRQTEALQNFQDRTMFLPRITAPTTIIHGSDDKLIEPAASTVMHTLIDNSILTIYPGMGHELPDALWDEFVGQICEAAKVGVPVDARHDQHSHSRRPPR